MKTFNTLFEALLEAGKSCRQWESPRRPGVVYNAEELSEIATINDMNYPLESNATQYAAFPDGELCLVNFNTHLVTLLFSPCKVAPPTMQQPQCAPQYPTWSQCPPQSQFPPQFQYAPQSMQQPQYAPQSMPQFQYAPQPMQEPQYEPQTMPQNLSQTTERPNDQSPAIIWTYCPRCAEPITPGTVICPKCATRIM